MIRSNHRAVLLHVAFAVALLGISTGVSSQGIKVKRNAVVFSGSTANCSKPATINLRQVEKKTPEYRTIRSEGVRRGSARHDLLMEEMLERIKTAVADAADDEGCDCVVRKGDIKDKNGLTVEDLTQAVIDAL